jgi:hypothetical protein
MFVMFKNNATKLRQYVENHMMLLIFLCIDSTVGFKPQQKAGEVKQDMQRGGIPEAKQIPSSPSPSDCLMVITPHPTGRS